MGENSQLWLLLLTDCYGFFFQHFIPTTCIVSCLGFMTEIQHKMLNNTNSEARWWSHGGVGTGTALELIFINNSKYNSKGFFFLSHNVLNKMIK